MHIIHREHFTVKCDQVLAAQGDYIAEVIAKTALQGAGFVDGATFQFGWCIFKFVSSQGNLELQEPDFEINPFNKYRGDISSSLKVLLAQNEMTDKLGVSLCSARFDDKVIIRKGCLAKDRIYMERSEPSPNDSGWYISGAGEKNQPQVSELEAIYSYELLSLRPALLSCLLLPPGWLAVWEGSKIEAIVSANGNIVYSETS